MYEKYYFIGGLNIGQFCLKVTTCQNLLVSTYIMYAWYLNISFMPSKHVSMLIGCMTLLYDVYQKY